MTALDHTARLVIACPDRPGIVAAVTGFLYNQGANVTTLDEYSTPPPPKPRGEAEGRFFMRVEFTLSELAQRADAVRDAFFRVVGERYAMDWRLALARHKKRTAIFMSKHEHAALELLWRHKRGELHADITAVVANHDDHAASVREFGVPFHLVPISRDTKAEAEKQALELLGDDTELVVLARYMQILSPDFVARFPNRIINIHHSFLPAFVGARPYHQAHARGVKLIGATAHYVTPELDAGPIIEQGATRVTHKHQPDDLVRLGRNIERDVLSRAVSWHLDDRILVDGDKTVVFT